MSETGEQYRVSGLSEGPRSVTLLPYHDPGFVTPTDIGMRALTQRHALTGSAVARITGVSPRTVRSGMHRPRSNTIRLCPMRHGDCCLSKQAPWRRLGCLSC